MRHYTANAERPILGCSTNRLVSSGRENIVKAARAAIARENLNIETPASLGWVICRPDHQSDRGVVGAAGRAG